MKLEIPKCKTSISTEDIKKIQLEMLIQVDEFCKNNNIKYSLAFGTLLGAIRHKGYIPWDDDIDILMSRYDYRKFTYASKNSNMNFINIENYANYYCVFGKVVNYKTILREECVNGICDIGVYIDIFPYDSRGNRKLVAKMISLCVKICDALRLAKINKFTHICSSKYKQPFFYILKFVSLFMSLKFIIKLIEQVSMLNNDNTSKYVSTPSSSFIYEREWFDELIEGEFEGHKFPIPKEYHKFLTTVYGDYMKLPPIEKRVSNHNFIAYWK